MVWILLSLVLPIFIYLALVRPLSHWKYLKVPQYPYWITIKEIFLSLIKYRSMVEIMTMPYNHFADKRYFGLYQFYRPLLVLRDPDLIKQVTVKDFDHFVDHLQFVPKNTEPLWEKNLFSLQGDKWRHMRATLSPSFTGSKMKMMFGTISECAQQFVRYFEEQQSELITVEMKDVFTRFTNDVIASSVFGVYCDSMRDPNNNFYLMGKEIADFRGLWKIVKLSLSILMPKVTKTVGLSLFDKKVTTYFTEIVNNNIRTREKQGIIRQDMINLLLEARKETSKTDNVTEDTADVYFVADGSLTKQENRKREYITDIDIAAQALIFFFAGFDSVSALMCFTAYELAVNPDIQERLHQEINETLNSCNGTVTYEALSKMKYLDMVVSESLRKWPAGVGTDRVCTKPYTIHPLEDNETPVHLKNGDFIWIPVLSIHRDPQYYPEPERFDPERFNEANKLNIAPYTYMPFGTGLRSCIGNRFALMETKLVFFYMLNKFELTVVERTTVPLKLAKSAFQLTAENGFWLGLKSRKYD